MKILRKARIYDCTYIGKLREKVNPFLIEPFHFLHYEQQKFWKENVSKKKYLFWIIMHGGLKAGYIQLRNIGDDSAEFGIAINERFRSKKLGFKAIEHFKRIAHQMKLKKLWLHVKKNNIPAQNLFLKHGFIFMAETGDCIYMELKL